MTLTLKKAQKVSKKGVSTEVWTQGSPPPPPLWTSPDFCRGELNDQLPKLFLLGHGIETNFNFVATYITIKYYYECPELV